MSKNINMTQGRPGRLLFAFALPLMCGNIFQQLYTVVDVAIVGRGVGMDALAALGTVDWLTWMMLGVAQGLAQGFSVRISQKYGEGDEEGLRSFAGQAARLSVITAVLGTVAGQLGLPLFLQLLRVPAELRGMAELYARILFGGLFATIFFNYCSGMLRAIGDGRTPLKAMVTAALANILLDCVAVFGLGWGIAGAAAATVFSQCLAGVVCAVKIWRTPQLHFGKRQLQANRTLSRNLITLATPMVIKNIIIALGGVAVQTIVNGFNMSFIAGFTATNKLYGLLEIAAISYGYAVTAYVGQNYGAARADRIRSGMRWALFLSVATSLGIGALMLLWGRPITKLFISSEVPRMAEAAGDTAYAYLCVMSVCLPVLYLLYVYQAGLQGMGDTVAPMISGVIEFVVRVGVSALIGMTGYGKGIFGAEVCAWLGAAVFLGISYYRRSAHLLQTEIPASSGPSQRRL